MLKLLLFEQNSDQIHLLYICQKYMVCDFCILFSSMALGIDDVCYQTLYILQNATSQMSLRSHRTRFPILNPETSNMVMYSEAMEKQPKQFSESKIITTT